MTEYYDDRTCACGCGGLIKIQKHHKYRCIPKFIKGHSRRGKKHTKKAKDKISRANKGRNHTDETKKKMSDSHKGKKFTEEHKKSISKSLKGKYIGEKSSNYGKKFTEIHKKRISDSNKGKKLTEEHKKNISKTRIEQETAKDENNPNYNPNLTDEYREKGRFLDKKELIKWRESVYERDNHTCQICGDNTGGNLISHHIFSWNTYKEFRYLIKNGATLCEDCHKEFHDEYGYGNNNLRQYLEYKIDKKLGDAYGYN